MTSDLCLTGNGAITGIVVAVLLAVFLVTFLIIALLIFVYFHNRNKGIIQCCVDMKLLL